MSGDSRRGVSNQMTFYKTFLAPSDGLNAGYRDPLAAQIFKKYRCRGHAPTRLTPTRWQADHLRTAISNGHDAAGRHGRPEGGRILRLLTWRLEQPARSVRRFHGLQPRRAAG